MTSGVKVGLKTNGSLWACGHNYDGELGDGTTTNCSTPKPVMAGVAAVSAGAWHTMILKTDGSLWACGYNAFSQLGDGTTDNCSTPKPIMTDVAAVSAGGYHIMILKTDDTLWACGLNQNGQLGDGTSINRHTPVLIAEGTSSVNESNRLYPQETTLRNGVYSVIPVVLENEKAYGGLEFDVTLPAGVTLTKATKTSRIGDDFTVQTSNTGGNTYKVLVYNTNRETISGNDDPVLKLNVKVANNMAKGNYEIKLSGVVASGVDSSMDNLGNSKATLHIEDYIKGDATGDGYVKVNDIMAVANYILKIPMETFNEQAANVNGDYDTDGKIRINVADIMGIANIILKVNATPAVTLDPQ